MTVYIVTDGEYSDYYIRAVFSTLQKAEKYAAIHKLEASHIEPFEMDEIEIEGDVKIHWATEFTKNLECISAGYTDEPIGVKFSCAAFRGIIIRVITEKETNKEKIRKIAQDEIARWKYNNQK